jgi:putative endonuclease
MDRDALGIKGEDVAARHLATLGCRVIARRWRTRLGEIDLVAMDGGEVVFVEVKTRLDTRFGSPEESVTAAKRRRLRAAAYAFLAARGIRDAPFRIDVIAVEPGPGGARVRHHRNAVGED